MYKTHKMYECICIKHIKLVNAVVSVKGLGKCIFFYLKVGVVECFKLLNVKNIPNTKQSWKQHF